ncbi:MAG TPA: hypothetical protein VGX92_04885 [Pyrinomonadaceae bacterium]|jgi:predicted nucleotidyltransferase|nr:hypothetical protein [Pyrinomonadaceae bacterium]
MPLPNFNRAGDLPEGLHRATIDETLARFGTGPPKRQAVAVQLRRIYALARETGRLERFIIFGSFITGKPEPNDVDIVLIMRDDFVLGDCDKETGKLFNHMQAEEEFKANIFWIRPSMIVLESLDQFIEHWQVKRDRTRRGIVEVRQ